MMTEYEESYTEVKETNTSQGDTESSSHPVESYIASIVEKHDEAKKKEEMQKQISHDVNNNIKNRIKYNKIIDLVDTCNLALEACHRNSNLALNIFQTFRKYSCINVSTYSIVFNFLAKLKQWEYIDNYFCAEF